MENELMSLPMVALRGLAVLPEQVTHFDVSREKSVQAITQAMKKDQKIFLVMQKEVEVEEPKEPDLYRIGCIATVKKSKACKRTCYDDRRDKIAARHGRYNCCQSSNGL